MLLGSVANLVQRDGKFSAGLSASHTTSFSATYTERNGEVVTRRFASPDLIALYEILQDITLRQLQVEYRAANAGYVRFASDSVLLSPRIPRGAPLFTIESPIVRARLLLPDSALKYVRPYHTTGNPTAAAMILDSVSHPGIVVDAGLHTINGTSYTQVIVEMDRSLADSLQHLSSIDGMTSRVQLFASESSLAVPSDALFDVTGMTATVLVAHPDHTSRNWVASSRPVRVSDAGIVVHRGVHYVAVDPSSSLVQGEIVLMGRTGEALEDGGLIGPIGTLRIPKVRDVPGMVLIPSLDGRGNAFLLGWRQVRLGEWSTCGDIPGEGLCRLPRWLFDPAVVHSWAYPGFPEARVELWDVWRFGDEGCLSWRETLAWRYTDIGNAVCPQPLWLWFDEFNGRRQGFLVDNGCGRNERKRGLFAPFQVRCIRFSCEFDGGCNISVSIPRNTAELALRRWIWEGLAQNDHVEKWKAEDLLVWDAEQGYRHRFPSEEEMEHVARVQNVSRMREWAPFCNEDGIFGCVDVDSVGGHAFLPARIPGTPNLTLGYWILRELDVEPR